MPTVSSSAAKLILQPGREKSLRRRHPWVYSGAVAAVEGAPGPGETVEIRAASGQFLAWAAYSPSSQIIARVWDWQRETKIGASFFRDRIARALALRRALVPEEETDALRLVHGESDGLPGLVVDRYGEVLVVQCLSAGAERWRETIIPLLRELTGAPSVFERSDAETRELEGLPRRVGSLTGGQPPERLAIRERGLSFWVDVGSGQKTGFFLDQRPNRARVGALARGKEVLDCFCYSGGFTVHALAAGAESVLALDASADALELARANVALNRLPQTRVEWLEANAFQALRRLRDESRRFDLVILDPPKFAPTAALASRAARGYKDINWLAFKLLKPGGLLATFSCSGGVSAELFQKIVAGAALDAGVEAQIVARLTAGPDHPVALTFPEGEYLKGLVLRVL